MKKIYKTLSLLGKNIDIQICESLEKNHIFAINKEKLSCDVFPKYKVFKYMNVPFLKVYELEIIQEGRKTKFVQKFEKIFYNI